MAILKKIRLGYGRINFRAKLLMNFFLVNFIVLFSLSSYYYTILTDKVYMQQLGDMEKSVSQLAVSFGHVSDNIQQTSEQVVTNATVCTAMSTRILRRDFDDQIEDYALLKKVVNDAFVNNVTIYTTLYFRDDAIYLNRDRRFVSLKEKALPWIDRIDMEYSRALWTEPYQMENNKSTLNIPVVGLARIARDYNMNTDVLGIVCVYVKTDDLVKILQPLEDTFDSQVLLVHQDGTILSSTQLNQIGLPIEQIELFQDLDFSNNRTNYQAKIHGEQYLINQANVSKSAWRLVSITPAAYFKTQNRQAMIMLGSSFVLVCLVLFALDSILSASLARRVKKLLSRVVLPDGGIGINPQETAEFYSELRQIFDAFTAMKDRNRQLTEHILQEELEKKEAQLSVMQAQIDSHFLYNSLDVINWMAIEHGTEDIAHMIQLLSRFYRLSLSEGNEIVSLEDEIVHVKTYLEIQKIRFEDIVRYNIYVEPDIKQQKIVKLVLQPIVENAIIHGLLEKPKPGGCIDIAAVRRGNQIYITVKDDGVGIPPEKVKLINSGYAHTIKKDDQSRGSHFGLSNIKDRLRLYYRDSDCLQVLSSPAGTVVSLIIPVAFEDDKCEK